MAYGGKLSFKRSSPLHSPHLYVRCGIILDILQAFLG